MRIWSQDSVGHAPCRGVSEFERLPKSDHISDFPSDTHRLPLRHAPNSKHHLIRLCATKYKRRQGVTGNRAEWKNEYEAKGYITTRDLELAVASRCGACSIPSNGAVVQILLYTKSLLPPSQQHRVQAGQRSKKDGAGLAGHATWR